MRRCLLEAKIQTLSFLIFSRDFTRANPLALLGLGAKISDGFALRWFQTLVRQGSYTYPEFGQT